MNKDIVQRITDYEKDQEARNKALVDKLRGEIRARNPKSKTYEQRHGRRLELNKFSFRPTQKEVHSKIEDALRQNFKDYMRKGIE